MSKKRRVDIHATFEFRESLGLWVLKRYTYEGNPDGLSPVPFFPHPKVKKDTSNEQFIEISGLDMDICP